MSTASGQPPPGAGMAAAATMTAPFRSLEAATSMPLPGKVHGAQVLKSIAPWRQCQITGPSRETGKFGGVTVGLYPTEHAAARAWDVARAWQAEHGQRNVCFAEAGFNFPEAGNEHDVELRRVLAGLPDLQAAARHIRKHLVVAPPLPDELKARRNASKGTGRRKENRDTAEGMLALGPVSIRLTEPSLRTKRVLVKEWMIPLIAGWSSAGSGDQSGVTPGQAAASAGGEGNSVEEHACAGSQDGEAAAADEEDDGDKDSKKQNNNHEEELEEEEEEEEDEDDDEESPQGGRRRRGRGVSERWRHRPVPPPLQLQARSGACYVVSLGSAGKDGFMLSWRELQPLLDELQPDVDDTLVLSAPAAGASGSAGCTAGYLRADVHLRKAGQQQQQQDGLPCAAASGSEAADTSAGARPGSSPASCPRKRKQPEPIHSTERAQQAVSSEGRAALWDDGTTGSPAGADAAADGGQPAWEEAPQQAQQALQPKGGVCAYEVPATPLSDPQRAVRSNDASHPSAETAAAAPASSMPASDAPSAAAPPPAPAGGRLRRRSSRAPSFPYALALAERLDALPGCGSPEEELELGGSGRAGQTAAVAVAAAPSAEEGTAGAQSYAAAAPREAAGAPAAPDQGQASPPADRARAPSTLRAKLRKMLRDAPHQAGAAPSWAATSSACTAGRVAGWRPIAGAPSGQQRRPTDEEPAAAARREQQQERQPATLEAAARKQAHLAAACAPLLADRQEQQQQEEQQPPTPTPPQEQQEQHEQPPLPPQQQQQQQQQQRDFIDLTLDSDAEGYARRGKEDASADADSEIEIM